MNDKCQVGGCSEKATAEIHPPAYDRYRTCAKHAAEAKTYGYKVLNDDGPATAPSGGEHRG